MSRARQLAACLRAVEAASHPQTAAVHPRHAAGPGASIPPPQHDAPGHPFRQALRAQLDRRSAKFVAGIFTGWLLANALIALTEPAIRP